MDGIYRQQERPLSENMFVAVAISEPRFDQRHAGVFFRFIATEPHEFLHLAWQRDLRLDAPKSDYLWVDPAIPSRRLLQVAAVCNDIASANHPDQIPYSFGPPNNCFDEHSCAFLLGPTNTGLTCASFVLAVFHRAGIQLVKYGTWPKPTQEDIDWQQKVLANLRDPSCTDPSTVTQEHIQCVQSEIGTSVRYRPEHVAAAAIKWKSAPVRFQCVSRLGEVIVAYIRGEPTDRILNWWGKLRMAISCWLRVPL
jgi:hypothetical protein